MTLKQEIYKAPISNVETDINRSGSTLLYSPTQVGIGTYIGGPFAAMYFLKGNFDALGKYDLSKKVMIIGLMFSAILFAVSPFIPDEIPNSLIALLYLIPVILTVQKHQLSKQEIADSEIYGFQSSWKVLGVSVLWMMLFLAIFTGLMFGLESIGAISLD